MNVQPSAAPAARSSRLGVIDCDIHPLMRSPSDLRRFLAPEWREHFDTFGSNLRQPFAQGDMYPKVAPYISRRDAYPPGGGPPGSDVAFMREQHLDPHNVEVGILQVLTPSGSNQRNVHYGAAVCAAVNDWQVAEFVLPEPRLKASLLVTQEHPEAAIAEIGRNAPSGHFAQISFAPRSIEPLGRRRYWPIYAAACDAGLPLGLHSSGNNGHPPVAGGGWPSYYAEQHQLVTLGIQGLVTSLVMEGVFEEFRELRFVFVEGGFTWVPPLCWRLDRLWHRLKGEVPHVRRSPSEYIREHFWFTTQPMDEIETPDEIRQTIDWIGWDRLCFSSDYPHWDYDDTRYAFPFRMTPEQRRMIFRDNARALYRLP